MSIDYELKRVPWHINPLQKDADATRMHTLPISITLAKALD